MVRNLDPAGHLHITTLSASSAELAVLRILKPVIVDHSHHHLRHRRVPQHCSANGSCCRGVACRVALVTPPRGSHCPGDGHQRPFGAAVSLRTRVPSSSASTLRDARRPLTTSPFQTGAPAAARRRAAAAPRPPAVLGLPASPPSTPLRCVCAATRATRRARAQQQHVRLMRHRVPTVTFSASPSDAPLADALFPVHPNPRSVADATGARTAVRAG